MDNPQMDEMRRSSVRAGNRINSKSYKFFSGFVNNAQTDRPSATKLCCFLGIFGGKSTEKNNASMMSLHMCEALCCLNSSRLRESRLFSHPLPSHRGFPFMTSSLEGGRGPQKKQTKTSHVHIPLAPCARCFIHAPRAQD